MAVIGIDVSKKIDCLWLKDVVNNQVKTKVFENTAQGHEQLIHWLQLHTGVGLSEVQVVMEATGVYHECLVYYLY